MNGKSGLPILPSVPALSLAVLLTRAGTTAYRAAVLVRCDGS
jgi:hypothetical protein